MESKNFFEVFTHHHSCILKDEHKNEENSVPPCCLVCGKKITSNPFYCCEENCDDILFHKSCTELPLEIQHYLHPDHPLFLTNVATSSYGEYTTFECDACKRLESKTYFYNCDSCNFDLDLKCASITVNSVEHPSHKHPLKTAHRVFLCRCDACGTNHEGLFYACSTCEQFWIHQDCASLPTTFLNTDYHDHPLALAYSLPFQYTSFGQLCQICDKVVGSMFWVYHCGKCRFLVHVDCVTPQKEHFLSVLLPKKEFYSSRRKDELPIPVEDTDLDVVHLPLLTDFLSLADHFSKSIQLRAAAGENTMRLPKYRRGQPLALSFEDIEGSDPRLDDLHDHEKYQKKLCNACITPVTTIPFYKTAEKSNFILHQSCGELPLEIQHPFHSEHVLVLQRTVDLSYFICEGCNFVCNGLKYECADCHYRLDAICASLPTTIKYDAHANHTMTLKDKISRHCNACFMERGESTFAFGCGDCDFELHATCATYPSKVRYRHDDTHPYILTYRPVEDHDSDSLCDICELEINPMWWFYHCVECDKSIHAFCHPTYDWRSRMKFGGIITTENHEHPLHLVPVIPMNTQCNGYIRVITQGTVCSCQCDEGFDVDGSYYPMGFKCLECKYNLHYTCLEKFIREGVVCNTLSGY